VSLLFLVLAGGVVFDGSSTPSAPTTSEAAIALPAASASGPSPGPAPTSPNPSIAVASGGDPIASAAQPGLAGPSPQGTGDPPFINVSNNPGLEVLDPATGDVYVLDWDAAEVSVLSGPARIGTVDVGPEPFNGAYDAADGFVYVTNFDARNVSVINGTTLQGTVAVGTLPLSATYDSADGDVYVTNGPSDNVSVLNGTSVVGSVNVGTYPYASVYDPARGWVYVTNWDSGTVSVIDGTTVVATVTVGVEPFSEAYDAKNGFVYVMNRYSGTVSVLNGTTVKATVKVGAADVSAGFNTTFIDSALYDGVNGYVYVIDSAFESDSVSVINGTTLLGTIAVNSTPFAPAYSTATGTVYVPSSGTDNLSVISGTTYVGPLNVGRDPVDALFDGVDGEVYVTNYLSNNVSVILPENSIHFAESGLVKGMSWSITLGGTTQSTTGTWITFTVPNGSYNYSVGPVPGWYETSLPYTGTYTVTGASVTEAELAFRFNCGKSCAVRFIVVGLPKGTTWSATLNGTTRSSNETTISFGEPNGTYAYAVVNALDAPAISQSGSVTVTGANVTIPMTFTILNFTETGLPVKGRQWSVGVDGFFVKTPGTARTATATSDLLAVLNGSFPYIVSGPAGYVVSKLTELRGTINASGKPIAENVTFAKGATYALSFHEVGLALGSTFCVTIGGSVCAAKPTVSFRNLTPGKYAYTIHAPPGATVLVKNGTAWDVQPTGTHDVSIGATLQVRFSYPVTFTEQGLAAPFSWSVTSFGETGVSNNSTIVLDLTNGTHGFLVHVVTGYLRSPGSGRVMVVGMPASESVTFRVRDPPRSAPEPPLTALLDAVEEIARIA
jgi:YVTN family beta-propeller protein